MHSVASEQRGVGATLCGWTLERHLGDGPACSSWLGAKPEHPPKAGRRPEGPPDAKRAVVRVLRGEFARDVKASTEWLRASWAANRFHHARVVKILEQGLMPGSDGGPVLVRAWAHGESLEDAVDRGEVDEAGAMRLLAQVLDALEMAHAHGILHGALSPRNVIVTPHGSARLVDFATTPGPLVHRSAASERLASARRGPFLPPERRTIPVAPCTELADVWGAGACLYFALTGTPPEPDAPWLAGVDPGIAAIVALALHPDPTRRYESAYAMLGDVRRLLSGRKPHLDGRAAPMPSVRALSLVPSSSAAQLRSAPPEEPPVPATARQRRGNVLLLLAIALLAGFAAFVLVRERLAEDLPAPALMQAP
jgi:eukaryotic-like serine/threonine-protein kinase